jgi:sec-independent protein translocase protein TatB
VFGLNFPEFVVLAIVALIVLGPEELPRVARSLGKMVAKMQAYLGQVKHEVRHSMHIDLDEWQRFGESAQTEKKMLEEKLKDTLDQK